MQDREASKTALGAGPQHCRDTVKILCQEERIGGAGEFPRPGKMTRVLFQMDIGEGCQVPLHQPYFIVDSAVIRRLD